MGELKKIATSLPPRFQTILLVCVCAGGGSRLRFTALPNGDKTLAMSWKPVVICDPGNKEAH